MPSPKELAKALARQDSVTQQPRNRFLGAIADAAGYVSDQADRYVVPERDPLFGGMRGGDLLPLRNVNRLLDDLSYGGRITTGRGQTAALRPEVLDLAGVTGAMMPVSKGLGKAALREGARQIETGTGIGRAALDPRSPITTWHGSPHTFPPTANNPLGEFDPMKVGTGEGAQAYGVGAGYLAEAKKLAEGYAGANAGRAAASNGLIDLLPKPAQMEVYKAMQMTDGPFKKAKIDDIVSRFPESSPVFQANTGNLYKVDLPDEHVAKMLDWDKPMSEQHPSVQSALAKLDPDIYHPKGDEYSPDEVGAETYLRMANSPLAKNQSDASEVMRNAGITGIRYLDAASRDAAGKGTSNFVVFDPKHMNILERNGVGGAMMQRPKLQVKPPKEDIYSVADANFSMGIPSGNKTVKIGTLQGSMSSAAGDAERVKKLAGQMSADGGYIERLIVDQNGNVIEGQHRLNALRSLGVTDIPVSVIQDASPTYDLLMKSGKLRSEHARQIVRDSADMLKSEGGDVSAVLSGYDLPKGYEQYFMDAVNDLSKPKAKAMSAPDDVGGAMMHRPKQ
jgi:hypothetical protein